MYNISTTILRLMQSYLWFSLSILKLTKVPFKLICAFKPQKRENISLVKKPRSSDSYNIVICIYALNRINYFCSLHVQKRQIEADL